MACLTIEIELDFELDLYVPDVARYTLPLSYIDFMGLNLNNRKQRTQKGVIIDEWLRPVKHGTT